MTKNSVNESNRGDVDIIDMEEDLVKMKDVIENYKSNSINDEQNQQNKYITLYSELNPYFTPFEYGKKSITFS